VDKEKICEKTMRKEKDPTLVAVSQDVNELENIGYEQELTRSFSLISMIGFCFSILSCWAAISGTMTEAMENGGPAALVWGWLGVSIFSIFVAVSMAEICSSYPVSGGQYSWVLLIGKGTKWGHGLSYVTGCIQLAGLLCMGSTALYMVGQFIEGMVVLNSDGESFVKQNWQIALICWAMCSVSLCINLFGNSLMKYLSASGLWVSLGGFTIITIVVLAVSPEKQSASFVFTHYINESGWDNLGMVIIMGILQSAYSMCCYDAPTHSKYSPKIPLLSLTNLG
jgi:choline transport protein